MSRVSELFSILALVLVIGGYVANIVKLADCDFKPSYKAEIFRVSGVFMPPLGMVLGFIDIADGE